ncbi:MAG: pilus assembly protein N-terminal domain-containing protein [Pseudomonadota bacterium]
MRNFFVAILMVLVAGPALAHSMQLELDQSKVVRLTRPASGVVIGNASVADVIVHSPQILLVVGKSVGRTHFLVVGENGQTLYSGEISVSLGSQAGVVTTMHGREIQNSLCNSRCVDIVTPDSTAGPLNDTAGRIRSRATHTNGSGGRQ